MSLSTSRVFKPWVKSLELSRLSSQCDIIISIRIPTRRLRISNFSTTDEGCDRCTQVPEPWDELGVARQHLLVIKHLRFARRANPTYADEWTDTPNFFPKVFDLDRKPSLTSLSCLPPPIDARVLAYIYCHCSQWRRQGGLGPQAQSSVHGILFWLEIWYFHVANWRIGLKNVEHD